MSKTNDPKLQKYPSSATALLRRSLTGRDAGDWWPADRTGWDISLSFQNPLRQFLPQLHITYAMAPEFLIHRTFICKEELRCALQNVEDCSNDIVVSFGLDKHVILLITNVKYSTTNLCPENPILDNTENKGYCYMGIMGGVDFHVDKVKALTIKEYISHVRKILNLDMNGDYTMTQTLEQVCQAGFTSQKHAMWESKKEYLQIPWALSQWH
eukprot:15330398-Ditylum_brightwellii.AAC.1